MLWLCSAVLCGYSVMLSRSIGYAELAYDKIERRAAGISKLRTAATRRDAELRALLAQLVVRTDLCGACVCA